MSARAVAVTRPASTIIARLAFLRILSGRRPVARFPLLISVSRHPITALLPTIQPWPRLPSRQAIQASTQSRLATTNSSFETGCCFAHLLLDSRIESQARKQVAKPWLPSQPIEPRMNLEPHQRSIALRVSLLQPIERAVIVPSNGVIGGDAVGRDERKCRSNHMVDASNPQPA